MSSNVYTKRWKDAARMERVNVSLWSVRKVFSEVTVADQGFQGQSRTRPPTSLFV